MPCCPFSAPPRAPRLCWWRGGLLAVDWEHPGLPLALPRTPSYPELAEPGCSRFTIHLAGDLEKRETTRWASNAHTCPGCVLRRRSRGSASCPLCAPRLLLLAS